MYINILANQDVEKFVSFATLYAALTYYGASLGSSLRSDLIVNYSKVFTHAMEAGVISYNIMVKHGWMEKQPEAD
ncbi:DUF3231 family protein [Bacillus sp. MM2020_1]|nr:DUF3231 family protein [Bacillus sp. MM2020_1]